VARDAALAELVRQIDEGELSDPRLLALTDEALANQADSSKPWAAGWGNLLEAARSAGHLPDQKWRRYARQAVESSINLGMQPRVPRGGTPVVEVDASPARAGGTGFQVFWANDSAGDIGGHPLPYRHFEGFVRSSGSGEPERGEALALPMTPDMWAHLADGPQTLKLPLDLKIFYSGQLSATPVLEEQLVLSRCWNLAPASPLRQTRHQPGSDGGIVHGGSRNFEFDPRHQIRPA
jgi:hypothetical protein